MQGAGGWERLSVTLAFSLLHMIGSVMEQHGGQERGISRGRERGGAWRRGDCGVEVQQGEERSGKTLDPGPGTSHRFHARAHDTPSSLNENPITFFQLPQETFFLCHLDTIKCLMFPSQIEPLKFLIGKNKN